VIRGGALLEKSVRTAELQGANLPEVLNLDNPIGFGKASNISHAKF